jgi:hypothetical protein
MSIPRKRRPDDFASTVREIATGIADLHRDPSSLHDLNRRAGYTCRALRLAFDSRPSSRRSCQQAAGFEPSTRHPVFSQTLSEDKHHRLTLLGLHQERRIPVHDHPGMSGIIFVLSGRMHSRQYAQGAQSHGDKVVELVPISDRLLGSNDFALVMPRTGHLHSLQALDRNAVFLSLHLMKSPHPQLQSWYFPAMPVDTDRSCRYWHKIQNTRFPNGI